MSEREFAHYSLEPKAQAKAHIARLGGDQWWKEHSSCNCAEGHCYHPWATKTPHFNPPEGKKNVAKSGVEKSDKSEGEKLYPSKEPPLIPEYYAACHFSEFMPDVVDIDNVSGFQRCLTNMARNKCASDVVDWQQIFHRELAY